MKIILNPESAHEQAPVPACSACFRTDFEGLYIDVSVRNRLIGLTNLGLCAFTGRDMRIRPRQGRRSAGSIIGQGFLGFWTPYLKAHFRGRKYVLEVLKMLPEMPEANSIDQALEQAANLGRINQELSAA
jgi:hypothetical protein